MKRGCTATMLKQKCSRRSGWENLRHDQKKHVRVAQMWRWGWQFFDWKGIVHHEFVPRGETVNKEFYLKVMKRLREAVQRKRPEAWTNKTWMLHHDNAPAHASLLIHEFLAKQDTIVVPQPPYSPYLALADFFLFPKLKSTLKGHRFQTIEEIKENSLQDLRAVPQNTFQDAFQNWKKRWERCINSRGEFFEGDKSD